MAETTPLVIQVSTEQLERLNALARSTGRSSDELAREALVAYVDDQEWQVGAILEAIDSADAGEEAIEHGRVRAWTDSWGTSQELPRPR